MVGMRRRGRPGLIGVAARTAVISGTATAVSGRVARRQAAAMAPPPAQPAPVQPPPVAQAPVQPPAVPPPDGDGDLASQLERLGQLAASGVLTPDEFAAAKARLLS